MPTRHDVSIAHRRARHRAAVGTATTGTTRLWRLCNWLIATAKAHNQLTEAQDIIRDLIDRLDAGEKLQPAQPASSPPDDGPQTPWFLKLRATSARRDDVA